MIILVYGLTCDRKMGTAQGYFTRLVFGRQLNGLFDMIILFVLMLHFKQACHVWGVVMGAGDEKQ